MFLELDQFDENFNLDNKDELYLIFNVIYGVCQVLMVVAFGYQIHWSISKFEGRQSKITQNSSIAKDPYRFSDIGSKTNDDSSEILLRKNIMIGYDDSSIDQSKSS